MQGFAFDPMAARWGNRKAAILLALFWAAWNSIGFIQTGHVTSWIVWQTASTAGLRIIIAWLYVGAGRSLLAAIVFHAMTNLSDFLFPVDGSHYDPLITGIFVWLLAAAALAALVRRGDDRHATRHRP